MSIRLPIRTVLDVTQANQGVTSTAGGWAYPFKVPQDTDSIVVKVLPSVVAGGARVYLQTSDDGGTTYYDVAVTSTASANAVGASPQWMTASTITPGVRTGVTKSASVLSAGIGGVGASVLTSQETSGLPLLGINNRVFVQTVGNATDVSVRAIVYVNSQSATS
jgi:hypothetical protein